MVVSAARSCIAISKTRSSATTEITAIQGHSRSSVVVSIDAA